MYEDGRQILSAQGRSVDKVGSKSSFKGYMKCSRPVQETNKKIYPVLILKVKKER
jgi:hypothetical protein